MSDLGVCCDGTWQDAIAGSNVIRLFERLDLPAGRKQYLAGVGTGGVVDHVRGGLAGWGIDGDLREGYRFLVEAFRPGDRIALFGFSRGAYLARSLAGMVGAVGIVDREGVDDATLDTAVAQAYRRYETHKVEKRAGRTPRVPAEHRWPPLAYDPRSATVPVSFVGVWDTVGALGIPTYLGIPDVLRSRHRYEFLDVVLDRRVPHARHAVSLDEMRGPFRPTLWDEAAADPDQDIDQVWFPGDHCDVGGGHGDDDRLSDGALAWMIEEAQKAGLPFVGPPLAGDPVNGTLHGMPHGLLGAAAETVMAPRPRATPPVETDRPRPDVHDSAYTRQQATAPEPPDLQYRPTRRLRTGANTQVRVAADRSWNATGLYLEPGTYLFTAAGDWGAARGRRARRCRPLAGGR
ncbi:DUF2235 domain-containing protein [Actinomycetospora flava]|uniref:DUF2235 domain-containing protein n=1 Tax=Actinomycetospora flava TaxID=3129232 RepID=A0ABU8M424_9PSEU